LQESKKTYEILYLYNKNIKHSAGIMMNVVAILALTLAINTWGIAVFGLDVVPSIFNITGTNSTCP
jgi:hypothetical protein